MITVIESLPKLLLSEAIRKIRDSFPPAARPPMFNGSLNFSLRIDLTNRLEARPIKVALHHGNCFSPR